MQWGSNKGKWKWQNGSGTLFIKWNTGLLWIFEGWNPKVATPIMDNLFFKWAIMNTIWEKYHILVLAMKAKVNAIGLRIFGVCMNIY